MRHLLESERCLCNPFLCLSFCDRNYVIGPQRAGVHRSDSELSREMGPLTVEGINRKSNEAGYEPSRFTCLLISTVRDRVILVCH